MEFVDIAQEMKREIDLAYYLEKVSGLCTRFIMYDKRYEPDPSSDIMKESDDEKKYKLIDNYTQKKAKDWLSIYVKEIIGGSSKIMGARGDPYKRAYNNAVKVARAMLDQEIGHLHEILQGD